MGACCQKVSQQEHQIILVSQKQILNQISKYSNQEEQKEEKKDESIKHNQNSQQSLGWDLPQEHHLEGSSLEIKERTGDQDEINESFLSERSLQGEVRGRKLTEFQDSQYNSADLESRRTVKSILKKKSQYSKYRNDNVKKKSVHFHEKKK